jgi:hypothetical protein
LEHAETAFHLGVAISAQEDALSCLFPRPVEAATKSTRREAKRLRQWVEVVEVQRGRQPVISA